MKLLINIIAIIVVAVVIGFQFNRTKNLYNKKYDENKDEFRKDQYWCVALQDTSPSQKDGIVSGVSHQIHDTAPSNTP